MKKKMVSIVLALVLAFSMADARQKMDRKKRRVRKKEQNSRRIKATRGMWN